MKSNETSFERLSRIVEDIPDDDLNDAIMMVRESRAGARLSDRASGDLPAVIQDLEEHELAWLDTVLCVRAQQLGRDNAWRKFAASSYRELLPFYH